MPLHSPQLQRRHQCQRYHLPIALLIRRWQAGVERWTLDLPANADALSSLLRYIEREGCIAQQLVLAMAGECSMFISCSVSFPARLVVFWPESALVLDE